MCTRGGKVARKTNRVAANVFRLDHLHFLFLAEFDRAAGR